MAKRRKSSKKSSSGVPPVGGSSAKIPTPSGGTSIGSLGLNSPGATKVATRYKETTTPRAARRRASK